MKEVKTLVPLVETRSEHDIVFKNKVYHLRVLPCDDGVVVQYVRRIKTREVAPDFLASIIPENDEVEHIKYSEHVHLKWYEKLLRMSLKKKTFKTIKRIKTQAYQAFSKMEQIDDIRDSLGIPQQKSDVKIYQMGKSNELSD